MLHPAFFNKHGFFYALGNTPAMPFTAFLPPNEDARVLLLGCGDPRSLLLTLYGSYGDAGKGTLNSRVLPSYDFTCCDIESAVLARNILLFSLFEAQEDLELVWEIFYHLFISNKALQLLTTHVEKLRNAAKDEDSWKASRLGSLILMCSKDTLEEISAIWEWWTKIGQGVGKDAFEKNFRRGFEEISRLRDGESSNYLHGGRSAGPLCMKSISTTSEHFKHFWRTGTTYTHATDVARANPSFGRSIYGNTFSLHYGTDPLLGFHLATAYTPLKKGTPFYTDYKEASKNGKAFENVVRAAKAQFKAYSEAFHKACQGGALTIRFFNGDAIAFCHTLQNIYAQADYQTFTRMGKFKALKLSEDYPTKAPCLFNVIDTSNLIDHLGFYNVFLSALPLLEQSPSAVMLTETMLDHQISILDGDKSLSKLLGCDPKTLFLILAVAPTAFLCNYTSIAQTAEVLLQATLSIECPAQMHTRLVWKHTQFFEGVADKHHSIPVDGLVYEPQSMAVFLYRIYKSLFASESLGRMFQKMTISGVQALSLQHNTRATFVMILAAVRSRSAPLVDWKVVMDTLDTFMQTEREILMCRNFVQEFYVQCSLMNVNTVKALSVPPKVALQQYFGKRSNVDLPSVVCVTLRVPRKSLAVLTDYEMEEIGTPNFQINFQDGLAWHNSYASTQFGFGNFSVVKPKGFPQLNDELQIIEDREDWRGKSDLLISCMAPGWTVLLAPESAKISLTIMSSPQTARLIPQFGLDLCIYSTHVNNATNIFLSSNFPGLEHPNTVAMPIVPKTGEIKVCFDPSDSKAQTLSRKINMTSQADEDLLQSDQKFTVQRLTALSVQIAGGKMTKKISFQYPVTEQTKLLVARKSRYLELVAVPIDAIVLSSTIFPVSYHNQNWIPWSFHRIQLDLLPAIDLQSTADFQWININLSLSYSANERAIREKHTGESTTSNVLLDVKESIFSIIVRYAGLQTAPSSVFALSDPKNGGIYTMIFVTDIRLDPLSQSFLADAAILPLTTKIVVAEKRHIEPMHASGAIVAVNTNRKEAIAWKNLTVSLVERCRTWQHRTDCDYVREGIIPLGKPDYKPEVPPICRCGVGQLSKAFMENIKWAPLAKYCTRIAIGGLYCPPYLQAAQSLPSFRSRTGSEESAAQKCPVCDKAVKKLLRCARCQDQVYCSRECQKGDWKSHKKVCGK